MPTQVNGFGEPLKFFLIENIHTLNDYPAANPFLRRQIFNHVLRNGLLVFHIENEHLTKALLSNTDIECADGNWQWTLKTGRSTPYDLSDDIIARARPLITPVLNEIGVYDNPNDERDKIQISLWAGFQITYTPLTPLVGNDPTNRYTRDALLGDNEDFFREGEADVFSPWSNPDTYADCYSIPCPKVAFEILSYNASTKEYVLAAANNENSSLSLKPAKRFLGWNPNQPYVQNGWIYLAWGGQWINGPSIESDYYWSELQRKIGGNPAQGTGWTTVYSGPTTTWSDHSLNYDPNGDTPVYFRVRVQDIQGKWSLWSNIYNTAMGTISWKRNAGNTQQVNEYSLGANFPNPFNPETQIQFSLAEDTRVDIVVYDLLGKQVRTLINDIRAQGTHVVTWDGKDNAGKEVASGVYLYRLAAGGFTESKKMILTR